MSWLLPGVLTIAATLAFIGLYFGLLALYDKLRDRYQARRKHARHASQPPRRVYERTKPPAGDKSQREAAYDQLAPLPEPGKDYISDRTVVLPYTRQIWQPPRCGDVSPGGEFSCTRYAGHIGWCADENKNGGVTWAHPDLSPARDERKATDTDVRAVTCAAPARPASMLQPFTFNDDGCEPEPEPDVSDVLPDWVIAALNGHNGVDAAVESIVARAVSDPS